MTEYEKHLMRMQTGVAYFQDKGKECDPKHLRVGVNAAMSDQGGLARLLIKKGVFTEDEYVEAVTEAMGREADNYESRIQQELSPNWETDIRLGTIEDMFGKEGE